MIPLTPAQRELIEANLRLVPWVLNRWPVATRNWDDAYQDGMLGLIRAAQKYEPDRGTFATYAVGWIRSTVQKGGLDVNGRRCQRNGLEPDTPVSLDVSVGDCELGDLVADPSADDPEAVAVAAVAGAELATELLRYCRDLLDVAIVAAATQPGFSRAALARDFGVDRYTVTLRIRRLAETMLTVGRAVLEAAA